MSVFIKRTKSVPMDPLIGRLNEHLSINAPMMGRLYTGRALEFDGATSKVAVGDVSASSTKLVKTLIFFYKADDTGSYMMQLSDTIFIKVSAGVWSFTGITAKPYQMFGVSTKMVKDTWQMVIIDIPDGADAANVIYGLQNTTFYYDGSLANCSMWTFSFTQDEREWCFANPEKLITQNLSSTHYGDTLSSVCLCWHSLVEGSGTIAYDGSGNNKDGTITSGTWVFAQTGMLPQTALMSVGITAGVMYREDPDNVGYDIQGVALNRSKTRGLNFFGDGGYLLIGDIGTMKMLFVVAKPYQSEQVIIDCDGGIHQLGMTQQLLTDFIVLNSDGDEVPITHVALASDGSDIDLIDTILTAGASASAIGWLDEQVTVNQTVSGQFITNRVNVVSIKSNTGFSASEFKTDESYSGLILAILVYNESLSDTEEIKNQRIYKREFGGV